MKITFKFVAGNDFICHCMQWRIKSFIRINIEFMQIILCIYSIICVYIDVIDVMMEDVLIDKEKLINFVKKRDFCITFVLVCVHPYTVGWTSERASLTECKPLSIPKFLLNSSICVLLCTDQDKPLHVCPSSLASTQFRKGLAATLRGSRPGVQSASLIMTSFMTS